MRKRGLVATASISVGLALCLIGACSSTDESGQGGTDGGGGSSTGGAGGACQGNVQKESFWPTLCAVAAACDWIDPGCNPELECTEAECNERHESDLPPTAYLSYLAAFESCVNDAASCLGCSALRDCYGGLSLSQLPCEHMVRCGFFSESFPTVAECQASFLYYAENSGKFDSTLPLYCLNELAAGAPCTDVEACLDVGG